MHIIKTFTLSAHFSALCQSNDVWNKSPTHFHNSSKHNSFNKTGMWLLHISLFRQIVSSVIQSVHSRFTVWTMGIWVHGVMLWQFLLGGWRVLKTGVQQQWCYSIQNDFRLADGQGVFFVLLVWETILNNNWECGQVEAVNIPCWSQIILGAWLSVSSNEYLKHTISSWPFKTVVA